MPDATNVRIYNDVIFLELPEGSCSPSTITPTITVSPGATISPASGAANSLRREVSSLSGMTSEYFQYIVTASNNETRKTYKVFVDCPQGTNGCFGDEVDVSVLMNIRLLKYLRFRVEIVLCQSQEMEAQERCII